MPLEVRAKTFYGVEITDQYLYTGSKRMATCQHEPNLLENFCPKCGMKIIENKNESQHYDSDYGIFHGLVVIKEDRSKRIFLTMDFLEVYEYNAGISMEGRYIGYIASVNILAPKFRPDICRETIMKKLPKEIWDVVEGSFKLYCVLQIGS